MSAVEIRNACIISFWNSRQVTIKTDWKNVGDSVRKIDSYKRNDLGMMLIVGIVRF